MDPMTIAVGVQGVANYFQAEGEAKRTEARYQQNRINAAAARDLKINSLNQRAVQEAEATAGQKFDLAIQALETREARKVAAGESGLSGRTFEAQEDMVTARELRGATVLNDNLRMVLDQLEDEKQGFNTEMLNRINSLPRGYKPNVLAHALSTAANMYATETMMTGKSPFSSSANPMTATSATMPVVGQMGQSVAASPLQQSTLRAVQSGLNSTSRYALITGMPNT